LYTSDNQSGREIGSGGCVVGDARVVARVPGGQVHEQQVAEKLVLLLGDVGLRCERGAVLLPRDGNGKVARDDAARDLRPHSLTQGGWKVEWCDFRWFFWHRAEKISDLKKNNFKVVLYTNICIKVCDIEYN
jgi:hypothetical protein